MQIDLLTPTRRSRRAPAPLRWTAWMAVAAFAWVTGSPAPSLVVHHHAGDDRGHTHLAPRQEYRSSTARADLTEHHHHHQAADADHQHGKSLHAHHDHPHHGAEDPAHSDPTDHRRDTDGPLVFAGADAGSRGHWHSEHPYAFCAVDIAWLGGAALCGRAPARLPEEPVLAPSRGTVFARGPPAARSIPNLVVS